MSSIRNLRKLSSKAGPMVEVPLDLIGASGRRYRFQELLQHQPHLGSVWTASDGSTKFVLKSLPESTHRHFNEEIQPRLQVNGSPLLRLPTDEIPNERILVYPYFKSDLLRLGRQNIPKNARRKVLNMTLQALVELHDRDVVHLDVKPDNIVVEFTIAGEKTTIEKVQLIDLENAAHLPKGRSLNGMLVGNENWRSIEAHFRGELNKPTDMLSFGLVVSLNPCLSRIVSNVWLGRIVCGQDDDFKTHECQGALPFAIRLQRLVSYFGNEEGIAALIEHVGNEETNRQILTMLWEGRNEEAIPYRPFVEWPEVQQDDAFKDLIKSLTDLDPRKRITAAEALRHPWFVGQVG